MGYSHISCEPGARHAGAEISGIDLTQPLSAAVVRELRQALFTHGVIGFRDQTLTVDQQVRFAARFGEIYIHPVADRTAKHPEILPVYADEFSTRAFGEEWHSDASCDDAPPMGSILMLQELPDIGGDTMFASMYAAYEALSEPVRHMLEGLTAMHDGAHVFVDGSIRQSNIPRTNIPSFACTRKAAGSICSSIRNTRRTSSS